MLYGKDDMKRYGQAVLAKAKLALDDLSINVQTQIALNPDPEAIQTCLDLNVDRFNEKLAEALAKLEATV